MSPLRCQLQWSPEKQLNTPKLLGGRHEGNCSRNLKAASSLYRHFKWKSKLVYIRLASIRIASLTMHLESSRDYGPPIAPATTLITALPPTVPVATLITAVSKRTCCHSCYRTASNCTNLALTLWPLICQWLFLCIKCTTISTSHWWLKRIIHQATTTIIVFTDIRHGNTVTIGQRLFHKSNQSAKDLTERYFESSEPYFFFSSSIQVQNTIKRHHKKD